MELVFFHIISILFGQHPARFRAQLNSIKDKDGDRSGDPCLVDKILLSRAGTIKTTESSRQRNNYGKICARTDVRDANVGGYKKRFLAIILVVFLQIIPVQLAVVLPQVPSKGEVPGGTTVMSQVATKVDASETIKRAHELAVGHFFSEAEKLLRNLLATDPENAPALYELATILGWDGKYDESTALYSKLLKLQPENTGLHLEIGRVLLWQADRTGNEDYRRAAIREFESRLEHNPNDCLAMKQAGAAYLRIRELGLAQVRLHSAVELCPDDDEAQRLLAETLAAKKEFSRAIELLRGLIDRAPENPDLHWELADVLIRSGKADQAEHEYRTILHSYPFHAGSLIGLGRVLLWKGKLTEAKRHFQTALWTDVRNPDPWLGLADVESRKECWRTAAKYYQRTLAIDPQNVLAKSGLRQAQWMIGPGLKSEYTYLHPSVGLNQELIGTEVTVCFSEPGMCSIGYRMWRFLEDNASALFRHDYYVLWRQLIAGWLRGEFRYTISDFSDQPADQRKLHGWSADVAATPIPAINLFVNYSRIPVAESYTTINSNYYSDVVGGGLDGRVLGRLSAQATGSIARQHGTFPLGYWNSYYQEWVILAFLRDDSERRRGEAQISYRLLDDPVLFVRGGVSIQKSIRARNLPYWAPKSFPQEKVSLNLARCMGDRFRWEIEVRGTHVHEGSEWGYGVSALFTARLWNLVEVGTSASMDEVGTQVPWNGKTIGAFLRLR
jgi:tetratricopeptide (TPR) repeat protein